MRNYKNEPPDPLCTAIKRTREAFEDTQERFSRRVGIAVTTLSRFETGRVVPRDLGVLQRLGMVALEAGLESEAHEFLQAHREMERIKNTEPPEHRFVTGITSTAMGTAVFSIQQWRLMAAVRTAFHYYPNLVAQIEKAAGPALALVDEVLDNVDLSDPSWNIGFADLDRKLIQHAERQTVAELQKRRKSK